MFDEVYAHVDQKNSTRKQALWTHLLNVAEVCEVMGSSVCFGHGAYLVGLLHDVGKISKDFQNKILQDSKAHVDHSSLGGLMVFKLFEQLAEEIFTEQSSDFLSIVKDRGILYRELSDYTISLVYVIMSHHGQYDMVRKNNKNEYCYTMIERFQKIESEKELACEDIYSNLCNYLEKQKIFLNVIFREGFKEYLIILNKLQQVSEKADDTSEKAMLFHKSMLIRLLVSILKSADIKDSINAFESVIEETDQETHSELISAWENCINRRYADFGPPAGKLNKVRSHIAQAILKRSQTDTSGIYKLDLPTGAGKTLLSLRYGVNQMKYARKSRFFYVTSYLSVLEQNAQEIKNVLNYSPYILEHHSNIIHDEVMSDPNQKTNQQKIDDKDDSLAAMKQKFLIDDWSSPMILTTMVQFFNTLFKGHFSNLMRFKSLINSVIILDELQSLPTEVLYITNLALNFMQTVMRTTIVLSTATQPAYGSLNLEHRILYGNSAGEKEDIICLTENELKAFERTTVAIYGDSATEYSLEELKELICTHSEKSRLIILNTKPVVKELYKLLEDEVAPGMLYYLTTNLTANDRLKRLAEIKSKLAQKMPICVISTTLIEAGVDVDFNMVVRSMTGIDSIVQAMGRCNREGKYPEAKTYVINIDHNAECVKNLKGVPERKSAAEYIFRNEKDHLDVHTLTARYFEKLYANLDDQAVDETLSLLSDNPSKRDILIKSQDGKSISLQNGWIFYKNLLILNLFQSFKSAYDTFALIRDEQNTVIVASDEIETLLNDSRDLEQEVLQKHDFSALVAIKKIIRQLARYTVSVQRDELENCECILDGLVYILPAEFYNDTFGVQFETSDLLMA